MIDLPKELAIPLVLFALFIMPTAVMVVGTVRARKEKRRGETRWH